MSLRFALAFALSLAATGALALDFKPYGRGDFGKEEWQEALAEARSLPPKRTPRYLMGDPLLSDYLEEGLSTLGYSCEDYEIGRL